MAITGETVAGTEGMSAATVNIEEGQMFFRLVGP